MTMTPTRTKKAGKRTVLAGDVYYIPYDDGKTYILTKVIDASCGILEVQQGLTGKPIIVSVTEIKPKRKGKA